MSSRAKQEPLPDMKVFLLQEIVPNYRVPIFRRLAGLDGLDLTVFYSKPSNAMKREGLKNANEFRGFRSVEIKLFECGKFTFRFGILWRVVVQRPEVMISGRAGCFDALLLLLICKLFGIRMLWFEGGVPYIDEEKIRTYAQRGRMNRWFGKYNPRRFLTLKADGLIAYSEHAKRFYMMTGFCSKRIWVAPNSPDTNDLSVYREEWAKHPDALDAERRRLAPAGGKIIFTLGRLNKSRKVDVLLQALRCIREQGLKVSLVIVGDGSERSNLETLAARLGLDNVVFEGAIYDESELSKYFMISDVFVTPGVASLALKMAMFFGKPIVTVDYGLEVHDVREKLDGYVVPINDVGALAEKLCLLLQSRVLSTRMGENGAKTIRDRINPEAMIEGFRQAIFAERKCTARDMRVNKTDFDRSCDKAKRG